MSDYLTTELRRVLWEIANNLRDIARPMPEDAQKQIWKEAADLDLIASRSFEFKKEP